MRQILSDSFQINSHTRQSASYIIQISIYITQIGFDSRQPTIYTRQISSDARQIDSYIRQINFYGQWLAFASLDEHDWIFYPGLWTSERNKVACISALDWSGQLFRSLENSIKLTPSFRLKKFNTIPPEYQYCIIL